MRDYTNRQTSTATSYDQGLRSHMLKVYNYMATGLGISGATAYLFMNIPAFQSLVLSLGWVWMIALIVMAFAVLPRMMSMSEGGAKLTFYGYAVLLSVAVSPMFLLYTGESIARTFLVTSVVFLSMSLFGYTTKKDLTSLGTFAAMGILGVFLASLINIFLQSPAIHFVTSIIAVVASIALTAYDTQKIKNIYYHVAGNSSAASKAAIYGALQLYFDFVYMFIHLLQFMGNRD